MTRRRRLDFALLAILGATMAAAGDRPGTPAPVPPFAYHLRVVRVSAVGAAPGAAIGWAPNGGAPVVLPSEEPWGTPAQLDALAALLGGARAQAVTGFYGVAGEDGVLRFDRKVYVGDVVLDLSFQAVPPAARSGAHEVRLKLTRTGSAEPPLAEANVLLATDRTVAIAVPGAIAGDWVVLGVTPLEPAEAAEHVRGASDVATLDGGDVVLPVLLTRVEPKYPPGARTERVTGKIVLQAIIDREGVPRAPAIVQMTPGTEELAGAAVEAVQQWRYRPATRNGQPVPVWYHVVIAFRLD